MARSTREVGRALLLALAVSIVGLASVVSVAGAAEVRFETAQPHIFTAGLEGEVDPLGEEAVCRAEYASAASFAEHGWSGASGVECTPGIVGPGGGAERVTASLTGLAGDTEYHYRLALTSASGVSYGAGKTFRTFGVESFTFDAIDADGEPDTTAGSHPYELVTIIRLPHGEVRSAQAAAAVTKDLLAELPPGLIGNPTAVPLCPVRLAEEKKCSGDSQVGRLKIESSGEPGNVFEAPIYDVAPARGEPARLAGQVNLSTNAYIDTGLRTGSDYGITARSLNIPTITNPFVFEIRLWGVPANAGHDVERTCLGSKRCAVTPGTPEKPFLRLPTRCGESLRAHVEVDTYEVPGDFFDRSAALPAITGCENLDFAPTIEARPTTETADSPTGLHVDIHVPQDEDPEGLATADLKDAVVKLPPGFTIDPSSANGLAACTPSQFGLTTAVGVSPIHTTAAPAACPDASKIGTVEVDTPLVDHPLPGFVYVAQPYRNPFESLLAIYIGVDDPISGVVIKLAGDVEIGPGGQLTTSFDENPQLPFEDFKLDFFGGDLAALKTPALCGTYQTTSTLTPWSAPASGPPATPTDSHPVTRAPAGGGCPTSAAGEPITPGFDAGSESPLAGAFSPFVVHLSRPDGSQQFSALDVTPPPGLLASLAGIPYCPDAALAAAAAKSGKEEQEAASCPAAAQVGTVEVGAGAGPRPYYTGGKVYLAGPYKGAPLSLAIVTPALAGPYDLGDVVVRAALMVDPQTTQVSVVSDPIPTELKGIPLDLRSITVKMDRPHFTLNPTSCEAMALGGALTTVQGQTAPLSERFQVGGCGSLPFGPRLALRLFGKTNRNAKPRLRAVLQTKPGEANIRRAQVNLPHSLFLEQRHIKTVCTRVQFAAGGGHGEECPAGSIYGRARAISPLLERPLEGPVYLRSSSHALPDLVAALNGQIDVELDAKIDRGKNKGLRTTFEVVPDAPVRKFVLEMKGGGKGLLVNSEPLCSRVAHRRAIARFVGQNGKVEAFSPRVAVACRKGAAVRHPRRHHRAGSGGE